MASPWEQYRGTADPRSLKRAVQLAPDYAAKGDRYDTSPENIAELEHEIAREKDPANLAVLLGEHDKLTGGGGRPTARPPWEQYRTPAMPAPTDEESEPGTVTARGLTATDATGPEAIPVGAQAGAPQGGVPQRPTSFLDKARGAVDAALHVATGVVNAIPGAVGGYIGGAVGAAETALRGGTQPNVINAPGMPPGAQIRGGETASARGTLGGVGSALNEAMGQGAQALTFQPSTETGQRYAEKTDEALAPVLATLGGHAGTLAPSAPAVAPAAKAAAGAVGRGARGVTGAVGEALTPTIGPETARLGQKAAEQGIELRPHQLSQSPVARRTGQLAETIGFLGGKEGQQTAFNRAVIRLIDPASKAEKLTPTEYGTAMEKAGSAIGDVTARTDVPLAESGLGADLDAHVKQMGKETEDTRNINLAYVNELKQAAADNGGVIPGEQLQNIISELGRKIRGSSDGNLRDALGDLQATALDALRKNIESPEDAQAFDAARKQYAIGTVLGPLVAKTIEGDVPPSQLLARVTATQEGKRRMAKGLGGELGDLAKIGQLLKDPSSSGTAEKTLLYRLAGLGGATAGAIYEPTAATGVLAASGAATAYNAAAPGLGRAMIRKGMKGAAEEAAPPTGGASPAPAPPPAGPAPEPPIPVGEVQEGQPPIETPPTETIPVGEAREGQPPIEMSPVEPIPAGEATEVTRSGVEPAVPAGEAKELYVDPARREADMNAWRQKFNLGAEDERRASDVAQALQADAKAVHAAAKKFDHNPAAFDKEIARINSEGAARETQTQPSGGGGAGNAPAPVRQGNNQSGESATASQGTGGSAGPATGFPGQASPQSSGPGEAARAAGQPTTGSGPEFGAEGGTAKPAAHAERPGAQSEAAQPAAQPATEPNRNGGGDSGLLKTAQDRQGNEYTLSLKHEAFGYDKKSQAVLVEVRDPKSGDRRGFVDFAVQPDGSLRAENVLVAKKYQKRGLAEMMYRAARQAGYDISPGRKQTAEGAKMVEAFRRSGVINKEVEE